MRCVKGAAPYKGNKNASKKKQPENNQKQPNDNDNVNVNVNVNDLSSLSEKQTKHKYGTYKNVLLSDSDIENLKEKFPDNYIEKIENLSEGIELKGYKYKNHYLAILKWEKTRTKTVIIKISNPILQTPTDTIRSLHYEQNIRDGFMCFADIIFVGRAEIELRNSTTVFLQ